MTKIDPIDKGRPKSTKIGQIDREGIKSIWAKIDQDWQDRQNTHVLKSKKWQTLFENDPDRQNAQKSTNIDEIDRIGK